jgi:hypothetical protein
LNYFFGQKIAGEKQGWMDTLVCKVVVKEIDCFSPAIMIEPLLGDI